MRPLTEIRAHLATTADPAWLLKERVAENLFAYLVVERSLLPEEWVKELAVWAQERGWTVSLQGRKIYAVPVPLTKSAAMNEVARRSGATRTLAAGDSLLDADLLLAADLGWRPGHGELAENDWRAPHVVALEERGGAAGRRSCAGSWRLPLREPGCGVSAARGRGLGKAGGMTKGNETTITDELYAYTLAHNPPLDPVQRELVETTYARFPDHAGMQSAEEQAPLLAFLVRLVGARHVVEVGTFTGFSALAMAQALPADGTLIACDISEEWTAYGREAWEKAGVADRIDLRIAPALDTLRAMPAEPHIDFAYLDADKGGYIAYWEELVPRMRQGGVIAVDNVLFHGGVTDPAATGPAAAIKEFNEHVSADARMDSVLLTVSDGLTLSRKR